MASAHFLRILGPVQMVLLQVFLTAKFSVGTGINNFPCNYALGRWVQTRTLYPYSGKTCPGMWRLENCLVNGRPDTGYLNWRWQTNDPKCGLLGFNAMAFLEKYRGTVVAFLGDSIVQNFQDALTCSVAIRSRIKPARVLAGGVRHKGYRVVAYNLTVLTIPTGFLVSATPATKASAKQAELVPWNVYLDQADPTWTNLLPRLSLLVIGTGVWYTGAGKDMRNYYVENRLRQLDNLQALQLALATTRTAILRSNFKGTPVFMTFSPVHWGQTYRFPSGTCVGLQSPLPNRFVSTLAVRNSNMMIRDVQLAALLGYPLPPRWGVRLVAPPAPRRARLVFKVLDITYLSLARADAHVQNFISKKGHAKDCIHWCNPGLPNTWLDLLYTVIG